MTKNWQSCYFCSNHTASPIDFMMSQININTESGSSTIILGEPFQELGKFLPGDNVVIITDEIVYSHYAKQFPQFPVVQIGTGEKIKNLQTVNEIFEQLLKLNVDRFTFILGVGGGIVCDVTGFVASTFLRGLKFGYVSTTLLSQVDASLGGKTCINFNGFKNLIGIIRQPSFVFCDPEMLDTLSERDYMSGFAEIIKHAVIRDEGLFRKIENNIEKVKGRDRDFILGLISESIKIKAAIVEKDVNEVGLRRLLNYGHTFGHAIETVHNLNHGEAISLGMVMANRFSAFKGSLDPREEARLIQILENLTLLKKISFDKNLIWEAIMVDKKKHKENIHFVQIEKIGNGYVEEIALEELKIFHHRFKA